MINIILGAGCFDNTNTSCRAWFDDVDIITERKFDPNSLSAKNPASSVIVMEYEEYRVAAGMYQAALTVNASEPFMLSYNVPYRPSMEAVIYDSTGKASAITSVPVYGLFNGFWINETGEDLAIVIQERDSGLLQAAYWISTLGFIGSAIFLIYRFGLKRTPRV
jgi:hypothetical protein